MRGLLPLAVGALGLAGLGFGIIAEPVPRVVWNASASAPLGLYRVTHGPIRRGAFVLAEAPSPARQLAAARGYLPLQVRLVKRVAAMAGNVVCAAGNAILIDGREVAKRLQRDSRGRPLPAWEGCRTLGPDEVFLLMAEVPDSFDGRYFGPISRDAIIGTLAPVWTFWPGHQSEARGSQGEVGDSRIKRVPSDSSDGPVCTSVLVTAPFRRCRHPASKPLDSLLTQPVNGRDRAPRGRRARGG